MRSRLNLALVGTAGTLALVLTVVRQSPEGVVSLSIQTPEVRAAPGQAQVRRHDLSALAIFNKTLLKVKDRYVDPSRVDPKKMLYAALDSVQYNVPEVLVEPDAAHNKITIAVNDKREVFDTSDVDSPWRMTIKLKKVFRFIETNMNAGADLAKVEYAAVNGMLSTLDPHSILMDPEAARDMDVSTSGKFGGLGIVIRMVDDERLTVVKPMKGTPATKAGIKAGDHIVKINNDSTENLTSSEAVDRMRGDPNTGVTLWISRKGEKQLLRFDLIRAVIRISQVEHKLLDKGVGYIKVKQFSKGIAEDVADAMKEMVAGGARSWILDLRANPGGLLEEAVKLSDVFVDSGTVVTTVSGRDRDARRAEVGFGDKFSDTSGTVAVLVNGNSASASEIVAGSLKNLDRAIVIGTRTFGKGSVQELYDNEDRSKLKLTIAQYLTPGDRSIQNLGIIPDISLQRMYVPEKNDSPADFVRLLPPTRTYGEKDLDAHLVSSYAKDTDKPAYELPFLVERKATDGAAPAVGEADPDDEEDPADEDDITEDFEMKLAKELVSSVATSSRPKVVAAANKIVQRIRADEERKLVAALSKIGVDWSAPTNQAEKANLEVTLTTVPSGRLKAGDMVSVTATVKNTGAGTAWRVLSRIQGDDPVFEDSELPIGKVAPGETKAFTARMQVPADALDRVDRLALDVREARNASARVAPTELHIDAAPRPVFAYAYQLVDESNGDGLVQRGEKYKLTVQVKNTGAGPTRAGTILLRNATGDGLTIGKSRFKFKNQTLAPGQVELVEFPLATDNALKGDEMIVELLAYDSALDVQNAQKLRFKIMPTVTGQAAHGDVTVKTATVIRAGASEETTALGSAVRGASYSVLGTFGGYTKVKLDAAGTKVGFLPASALSNGGKGNTPFTPSWNSTPPVISLNLKGLNTTADTYKLTGTITDEQHVEDVYIFVSNQGAKVDSRKVFYQSNRGGKDPKLLEFASDLPLWPGSNMVTIVARANSEVVSRKSMFVYRDPPRTAQTP
ncbi:MAG: MXAN_5808 family serine peptidase [Kofleriaceae bacterium]